MLWVKKIRKTFFWNRSIQGHQVVAFVFEVAFDFFKFIFSVMQFFF